MAADSATSAQAGSGDVAVYRDIAALPADARQLLEAAGALDIQNSAAWYDNFTRHVDLGPATAAFHVWRHEGRARLVLPLLQGADGSLRELGNYYSTRCAPVVASGLSAEHTAQGLDAVLQPLLTQAGAPHTLQLGPLEAGSNIETLLHDALRRQRCAVFPVHAFQNWLLPVQTDWPTYLAARDGKLRTTLSRMSRRFAARGGRLELLQGGDGLDRAIAAYETVYAASWKSPEPHPRFMPGLIRAAAALGQLRLALAWLGDVPVAAQVWMVAGGRADIYKLAHDEAHKETSPGTLLTALLMRHVFEVDRVQWVDYLSGDDAYKQLWMSEVRERRRLLACNLRTPRGMLMAARETAARGVKAVLRRPAAA